MAAELQVVEFPDPQVHPPWRVAFEKFGHSAHGTLITHEVLSGAMGLELGTRKYYKQVERLRTEMRRESNLALETVPDTGYRVVFPGEHSRLALNEIQKAYRRHKVAYEITVHVETKRLSEGEKQRLTILQTRQGALCSFMQRELRSYKKMLANPKEKIPKLPKAVFVEK